MNLLKSTIVGALTAVTALLPKTGTAQDIHIVNPPDLYDPAPNGYSHVIVANQSQRIVFVAGQGGETRTGTLSPNFEDQVRQAYANLLTALGATGARPDQVTRINTYVVNYDPALLEVMTREVMQVFGSNLPAQTLVPVPRLALDGMLFEVDATAVLGPTQN